jgi:hypothetical protein
MHIQQVKLEADEEEYQPEEQLDGARHIPTRGMAATTLSNEVAEQQFSKEIATCESAIGWKVEATEDRMEDMGDHCDLPICRKNLQPRRLHEQSQPLEQLDEVIEKIMELMVKSSETTNNEKISRRK